MLSFFFSRLMFKAESTSKVEEQSCHIENRLPRYLRYVCSSHFNAQRLYAYEIAEEG